jgi:hypothetical protein
MKKSFLSTFHPFSDGVRVAVGRDLRTRLPAKCAGGGV